MKRRHFLIGLALLPFPAQAASNDWQARLVSGGLEDGAFWAGLHITLGDGWKTYWRVPGEAGVPPLIKLEGPDTTGFEVQYPLPIRIADDSGEAIGYHHEVLLPIRIPTMATSPQGDLSAFFGVCRDICKPAKFDAKLADAISDPELIKAWRAKVPAAGTIVAGASQDKDELVLKLTQKVNDIFAEGQDGLYFRKPEFDGDVARLKIDGLDPNQSLSGTKITLTASSQGKGLEQVITVA